MFELQNHGVRPFSRTCVLALCFPRMFRVFGLVGPWCWLFRFPIRGQGRRPLMNTCNWKRRHVVFGCLFHDDIFSRGCAPIAPSASPKQQFLNPHDSHPYAVMGDSTSPRRKKNETSVITTRRGDFNVVQWVIVLVRKLERLVTKIDQQPVNEQEVTTHQL